MPLPLPSSLSPPPKTQLPELIPEPPKTRVLAHQLAPENQEVDCGWVSCYLQDLPEGGAGVVGVGLARADAIEGGHDGGGLGSALPAFVLGLGSFLLLLRRG